MMKSRLLFLLGLFIASLTSAATNGGLKRTVIITGANRGIGFQGAKQLAATGDWNVVMACRDISLGNAALNRIVKGRENCEVQRLDLASLEDVKRFCKEWKGQKRPLHVLAANAVSSQPPSS